MLFTHLTMSHSRCVVTIFLPHPLGPGDLPFCPLRTGRIAVARYWTGMVRKDQRLLELRMEEVNGQLAAVVWEGMALFAMIALMATQKGVQEIYTILNPEKLVYIQRQIEARQRTPQV